MCLACAEAHASVPSGVRCLRRACGGQLTGESQQVRALEMKLKRRQLASKDMAIETAQALVTAVGHTKGNNPRHLISEVQDIGRRLEEAAGDGELIVGNICRRVLFMIAGALSWRLLDSLLLGLSFVTLRARWVLARFRLHYTTASQQVTGCRIIC